MKKRISIFIFFMICFLSLISTEILQNNEKQLLSINKLIFEHYMQKAIDDTLSGFVPDFKYYLSIGTDKVFLLNSLEKEELQTINEKNYKTNHLVQYSKADDMYLPTFTDFNYSNEDLLFVILNKDFFQINNITQEETINIVKYITQRLYSKHLQTHKKDLVTVPAYEYPVLDESNRVLATYEYNFLLDACYSLINDNQEKALENLKYFYAVRLNRWRTENSFIQSFELSQEKINGLAFAEFYSVLLFLEEQIKNKSPLVKTVENLLQDISPIEYLNNKLYSIYDHNLISINKMSREKAELKGFLISSIYQLLDWDYQIETSKTDFHQYLGEKLDLQKTVTDSIYQEIINSDNYKYLLAQAKESKNNYLEFYNTKKDNYDFKLIFDHFTEEYFNPVEDFYINPQEQSILYPNVSKYRIKSQWLELEIYNQGFLYNINRRNKNLQSNLSPDTIILLDDVIIDYKSLYENPVSFFKIEIISQKVRLTSETTGDIYFKDGQYVIEFNPSQKYFIEEEYWDKIEELNNALIQRGVPHNWLAENINHENFKIYHSVSRYFTRMPEHQVKRGERSKDWYMRHFGVDAKIRKGADFRKEYQKELLAAEKRHGIHYELLMAIMAIESDYANSRWRGNFYTFPTLVSQYLLIPRRQRFATNELRALYQFSQKTNKDVYHFIGSFAGAAGWGQFIPTSMNAYFIDANDNFEEVDIFSIEDTLHSISNYLNKHGLSGKNMKNDKAKYSAVYAYNHSDAYVKAVLHIYEELYKQRKK